MIINGLFPHQIKTKYKSRLTITKQISDTFQKIFIINKSFCKNMQKNKQLLNAGRILAQRFLDFVNSSKSPFHVVNWCRNQLTQKGYQQLSQTSNWNLQKGAKYFFTRNNTTLVAFNVGQNFEPSNTGFKIVGAHTDSPCLRLAPVSKAKFKTMKQLHISTYGGGLWHTWFDRDLLLAGRIVYNDGQKYTSKLWQSKHPILKIPNLAIHLRAQRNKFEPNTETQLRPILSSTIHEQIVHEALTQEAKIFSKHDQALIDLISTDTGIKPEDILDLDLFFADSQKSDFVGLNQDFISSPRLDNLFSSFYSLLALTDCENKGSFINITALFDHEECGSQSAQGAGSNIIMQSLRRIYDLLCDKSTEKDNFYKTMQKSFLISADMAHGIHPNYSDKHQVNHQVEVNKGVVIKTNFNQRYITDLVSTSILRILAEKANVPIQDFIVKNDSPCGSTIGPILASGTGMKAIDIGIPMLGMHSIRQTCGVIDTVYYYDLFKTFFNEYESINHDLLEH